MHDVRLAEIRLEGPLDELRLDCGSRGEVILRPGLAAGESETVIVPIPAGVVDDRPLNAPESLRFLDEGAPVLPVELVRRSDPPVTVTDVEPEPLGILIVVAGFVLAFGLRQKPVAMLLAGLLAALAAAGLQGAHPPADPERVRVLEGTPEHWARVEGAADSLSFDPLRDAQVGATPGSARWIGERQAGEWSWRAEGRAVHRSAVLDPGTRRIDGRLNLWGPLAEAWTRDEAGDWRARGEWGIGKGLPEAAEGSPPGWLAAGLPQGRGVLVARLAEDAWRGEDPPPITWLRLVGFDFAQGH